MRNTEPYHINGKWKRFFVETTGDLKYKLTRGDIRGAEITASGYLAIPKPYNIIDVKSRFNTYDADATIDADCARAFLKDGRQGVKMPNTKNFDYACIWLFVS